MVRERWEEGNEEKDEEIERWQNSAVKFIIETQYSNRDAGIK